MAAPALERHIGTIKNFNAPAGYGFIASADYGKVFFLLSDVAAEHEPRKGDCCTYSLGAGPDGRTKAISVLLTPSG